MFKKILFCSLFILISLITLKQDSNAKTWKNTKIPVDSIIDAIGCGDSIIIDSCKIFGPLEKEGTWERLDTIMSLIVIQNSCFLDSVSFKHCYFMKNVFFEGVTFSEKVDFSNSKFSGNAYFTETNFDSNAHFSWATFDGDANFWQVTFGGDADFWRATFGGYANFWIATFDRNADFSWANFDSNAIFSQTTFGGYTDFSGATFDSYAAFSEATFDSYAVFSGATFGAEAYFEEATFDSWVAFTEATFGGDAYFPSATFDSSAIFHDATFNSDAIFSQANFDGDAYFEEATFGGDAYFSYAIFRRQVDLSPKEFKKMNILWEQLEGHLVYNRNANHNLMKYFEENRYLDDADGVYLFLKQMETFSVKWYKPTKYWGYLMWVTCGYGVMPGYTILWSIGIIVLFALFFRKSNAIREIEAEFGSPRRRRRFRIEGKRSRRRFRDALYFSFHTFLIGIVSDRYPSDEFLIGNSKKGGIKLFRFRTLSMIEGALGWILLILFVASLGKKYLR